MPAVEGRISFLVISDTHDLRPADAQFWSETTADVVLHCGDLTENGGLENHKQARSLIGSLKAELKLVIAGNHDLDLDKSFAENAIQEDDDQSPERAEKIRKIHQDALKIWKGPEAREKGIRYLDEGHHDFTLQDGRSFTLYASPYTPKHGEWAFQYEPGKDRFNAKIALTSNEHKAGDHSDIPPPSPMTKYADVVMTHGPPKYILDKYMSQSSGGCDKLRAAICKYKPTLHCFGHIHNEWGAQRVLWKSAMTPKQREKLLEGTYKGIDEDDIHPLPREYKNTRKPPETARAIKTGPKNKETLFVNAAIENEEGPLHEPWLVSMELTAKHQNDRKGKRKAEDEGCEEGSTSCKSPRLL